MSKDNVYYYWERTPFLMKLLLNLPFWRRRVFYRPSGAYHWEYCTKAEYEAM